MPELEVARSGAVEPSRATSAGEDQARLLAGAFLAGYAGRTREAYATDLRQWGAWCTSRDVDVLQARRAHVQLYAGELAELGRAPSTIGRKLSAIGGFYAYAVDEGELVKNPAAAVRRPRGSDQSTRFGLERAEAARLLAAAAEHSPAATALVCLLALNGLRVTEACTATRRDLSQERGHQLLEVRRKGGKRESVPLAPRTAAAVQALTGAGAGPLLGMSRYQAWRLVHHLVEVAGITKRISPHSLRHTFVTLALDAGVALRDVQDAAGHADPRTTRRYDRGRKALDRHATYAVADLLEQPLG